MEYFHQDDIIRIKDLLRHTGEFIAYFELVDTKMIEWREEMKKQASQLHHHTQMIQEELACTHDLLSQAGTRQFKALAESVLLQGQKQLQSFESNCNELSHHFLNQQEQLELLTHQSILKLEQHHREATQAMTRQLAQYDAQQFHRIAHESCDHVERVANNAVKKSSLLLRTFHLRFGLFGIFTSLITAFVCALYLSGEFPWDLHQKALFERKAGKTLLQAWPKLTLEEKNRIINHDG